jgi:hypothetical protein
LFGAALITLLTAPLSACSGESFDLPAGAACERSIQCGAGLACVLGACSGDATEIGGMVPENPDDPGAMPDAATPPPVDAGDPPLPPDPPDPPDPPPMDAGVSPMDGG